MGMDIKKYTSNMVRYKNILLNMDKKRYPFPCILVIRIFKYNFFKQKIYQNFLFVLYVIFILIFKFKSF